MTIAPPPVLRISTSEELIVAVPYLLGFHPEESLVLVGVNDATVTVTARIDLDDFQDPTLLRDVLRAIRRSFAAGVVAVVYTETFPRAEAAELPLAELAEHAGLELHAALFVSARCWRPLAGDDNRSGRPVPTAPTMVEAAATFAGMTARPSRQSLIDLFTPRHDGVAPDLLELHETHLELVGRDNPGTQRPVVQAIVQSHAEAQVGRMPTDEQVARFGVALKSYVTRDAIWLAIEHRRLHGIELWVNLARRLPPPYDAAPLFLAAWRSYRDGNGAMAGIAAERALRSNPDYDAAALLLAALAHGVDPRTLRPLLASDMGGGTTD